MNTPLNQDKSKHIYSKQFYIGLLLAISSSLFIGTSFIFKKKGLLRLAKNNTRAGNGGHGYLLDWMWWLGMLMMGGGELLNFAAYTMAPAVLVTPLGALSVLITALLSPPMLGESLNILGKIGCLLSITGSTMIVLHAPKEQEVTSSEQLLLKLLDSSFLTYSVLAIMFTLFLIFYMGPRYGNTNPLVYLFISSVIGSLTVMFCKGLGVILKEIFILGSSSLQSRRITLLIVLMVACIVCICVQMNYLNKALDIFNTGVVTPILYVLFTFFVIMASAILFKEFRHQDLEAILGISSGLVTIIAGIFLINAFKDQPISLGSLRMSIRKSDSTINGQYFTAVSTNISEDFSGVNAVPA